MRQIKFRGIRWSGGAFIYGFLIGFVNDGTVACISTNNVSTGYHVKLETVGQLINVLDKNGEEIYEGDKLRFADKWEWYRGEYKIKMMSASGDELAQLKKQYKDEPYEERVVSIPEDYEWLLSAEIQQYWEVVGNIHESPEPPK